MSKKMFMKLIRKKRNQRLTDDDIKAVLPKNAVLLSATQQQDLDTVAVFYRKTKNSVIHYPVTKISKPQKPLQVIRY